MHEQNHPCGPCAPTIEKPGCWSFWESPQPTMETLRFHKVHEERLLRQLCLAGNRSCREERWLFRIRCRGASVHPCWRPGRLFFLTHQRFPGAVLWSGWKCAFAPHLRRGSEERQCLPGGFWSATLSLFFPNPLGPSAWPPRPRFPFPPSIVPF